MEDIKRIIERWFNNIDQVSPENTDAELLQAIKKSILALESGHIRAAEKKGDSWQANQWVKKAILLLFRTTNNDVIDGGFTSYFDKVDLRYRGWKKEQFVREGSRVVPPAVVRQGSFVGRNTVIMPSYVNIGAYVDTGTMVDTWATVGSCAQIGKNVHLSGGVGIGGVLEPLQASPTIIEDNCFIGARSEIVEGVIVEQDSVISMGVYIGKSTKIYDREKDQVTYGRVPKGSVVVSGSIPSDNGKYSLYAAIIVKKVDAKTRSKVSVNELLRLGDNE